MSKVYLVQSGLNYETNIVGVYSTYEKAELAVKRQSDISNYYESKRNKSVWLYHFDGELTESYVIVELRLDLTLEGYQDELNSNKVSGRPRTKSSGVFTES